MSSKTINLDSAKKDELRRLCKTHGVKGYGKLSNDGMRAALRALIETDPSYETTGQKNAEPVVTTTLAADPTPAAATVPAVAERRNDVKRPKEGGLCAAVWSALDSMHAAGITPATKDVRELSVAKGWNENNALCELSAWRKHMGLSKAQPGKHGPRRKSSAKLAGLPRMSAEEVDDQYLA